MRIPLPRPVWLRARLPRRSSAPSTAPSTDPSTDPSTAPSSDLPTAPRPVAGDGVAEPGEVVWAWVPYEEDASRGKDRPVLVLAREGGDLLALPMTSKDHDRDAEQEARAGRHWMDVGTGDWDRRRRPSEVRLDRVVRLRDADVRREGAVLDPVLFAAVRAAAEGAR